MTRQLIITAGDGAANIVRSLESIFHVKSSNEVLQVKDNLNNIIILTSLGGRKGGPEAIRILKDLKELNVKSTMVAVMPLSSEGHTRCANALKDLELLREVTDDISVFSNDTHSKLPVSQAFAATDNDVREFLKSKYWLHQHSLW